MFYDLDDPEVIIDMFYDVDDLEVIVDTKHGICFVELPLEVHINTIEIEVILPKCEVYHYNFDFDDRTFNSLSDPQRYSYIYHGIHSYSDNSLLH